MPDMISELLVNYGGLGIFALYLIWQRQKDSERLDDTVDKLNERSDKEEQLIRERFDAVIEKYDQEREMIFKDISSKLDKILELKTKAMSEMPRMSSSGGATETMIERAVSKALQGGDE